MEIHGTCDDRFEPVRKAFEANFEQATELGACVAVTVDGEFVVDLWAGDAKPDGTPWERETIVNVYSTTKTMAAISVLALADRGEIDLDAPVAKYWPEFSAHGKEGVLVRHVMSHSAGLPGFDPPLASPEVLYDWDACCANLAAQAPMWEPGTVSGYHAITQGYLQGEIVRRATGRTLGTFFAEEIAGPLGADFHIGLSPEHDDRVAELVPPGADPSAASADPHPAAIRALNSVAITGEEPQTREWRAAEIPAAGGIGNARSVARVHSAVACGGSVDGVRILSEAGCLVALQEQTNGTDLVMGMPTRYGMGFGLNGGFMPISPNERAMFWGGWGGSLAIIDFDARVSLAYVMNHMEADLLGDLRGGRIAGSVYESLAS